jgi:hypothetical protein
LPLLPCVQVVKDLMAKGYVPSWCTACYRKGRTGEHFMKIAKAGNIHNFCHPNSLLTLQVRRLCCHACMRAVLCSIAWLLRFGSAGEVQMLPGTERAEWQQYRFHVSTIVDLEPAPRGAKACPYAHIHCVWGVCALPCMST